MYSEIFELQANLLKALAHSRRLEIVQLLRDQQLRVTDIYQMLDLPQANISQHLMILREAGVVKTLRDGKHIYYSLAHPLLIQASDALREVLMDQQTDSRLVAGLALSMNNIWPVVHDPVCQMRVSPKTAGAMTEYQDQTYYFCASGCLKTFTENPDQFQAKGEYDHQ